MPGNQRAHTARGAGAPPAGDGDPTGLMTTGGRQGGAQVGGAADAGVSPDREDYNLLEVYGEAAGGYSTAQAATGVDRGDYPQAGAALGLTEAAPGRRAAPAADSPEAAP